MIKKETEVKKTTLHRWSEKHIHNDRKPQFGWIIIWSNTFSKKIITHKFPCPTIPRMHFEVVVNFNGQLLIVIHLNNNIYFLEKITKFDRITSTMHLYSSILTKQTHIFTISHFIYINYIRISNIKFLL